MLYGFHENHITFKTAIVASDVAAEFADLTPEMFAANDGFVAASIPEVSEMLTTYPGLSDFPIIVEFRTEKQREAFDEKHGITILPLGTTDEGLVDYSSVIEVQSKMIALPEGEEAPLQTIEQMYNLDIDDRWSTYTPEQLAAMEAMKKKIQSDSKKNSNTAGMSGDGSFDPNQDRSENGVRVTDVRVKEDESGRSIIDNILGMKDTLLEPTHEFFIGKGENYYHKVEVYDKTIEDIKDVIELHRAKVYKDADYGCWVAFVAEKSGRNAKKALDAAGLSYKLYISDGDGNEYVPPEHLVEDVEHPRPWNVNRDKLWGMSEEDIKKNNKTYKGKEFAYTVKELEYPKSGCIVYITPFAYFEQQNKMWSGPLGISHILPSDFVEKEPGVYYSPYNENMTMHKLSEKGFIDNMFLKTYLNEHA
jgi:hypothetical protein